MVVTGVLADSRVGDVTGFVVDTRRGVVTGVLADLRVGDVSAGFVVDARRVVVTGVLADSSLGEVSNGFVVDALGVDSREGGVTAGSVVDARGVVATDVMVELRVGEELEDVADSGILSGDDGCTKENISVRVGLSSLEPAEDSCSIENSVTVFSSPFSMTPFPVSVCSSLGLAREASGFSALILQSMAC